ncbi:MAG: hypothetical protein WCT20_00095, partial [Candidatus Babeliales bacterium]
IFSQQELVDCSNGPLAPTQDNPTITNCRPGHQSGIQTTVLPFEVKNESLDTGFRRYDAILIPEKLAARFAAKEAFFKALCATLERKGLTQKEFSLSFICCTVSVTQSPWGAPQLATDWQSINKKIGHSLPQFSTHLSLSHDGSMAIAFVVIEE